jgi:hypothetical protein
LEELGRQIGVDPGGLVKTVERFNANARMGLDPDFGGGQSAYNDCLGDPGYEPNAAVEPLDAAPFYATEIYPSDVGTWGGLLTNEYAQVLDNDDVPNPGPLRHGKYDRHGHGAHLSGRRGQHWQYLGLRVRRRRACRRPPRSRSTLPTGYIALTEWPRSGHVVRPAS